MKIRLHHITKNPNSYVYINKYVDVELIYFNSFSELLTKHYIFSSASFAHSIFPNILTKGKSLRLNTWKRQCWNLSFEGNAHDNTPLHIQNKSFSRLNINFPLLFFNNKVEEKFSICIEEKKSSPIIFIKVSYLFAFKWQSSMPYLFSFALIMKKILS